jgi:GGDEF domain-containing protein
MGDRFGVVLPAADRGEAELRAEGIRELVERLPLGPLRLTASVGVAATRGEAASVTGLVGAAMARLEAAQREGGNRVLLAAEA